MTWQNLNWMFIVYFFEYWFYKWWLWSSFRKKTGHIGLFWGQPGHLTCPLCTILFFSEAVGMTGLVCSATGLFLIEKRVDWKPSTGPYGTDYNPWLKICKGRQVSFRDWAPNPTSYSQHLFQDTQWMLWWKVITWNLRDLKIYSVHAGETLEPTRNTYCLAFVEILCKEYMVAFLWMML